MTTPKAPPPGGHKKTATLLVGGMALLVAGTFAALTLSDLGHRSRVPAGAPDGPGGKDFLRPLRPPHPPVRSVHADLSAPGTPVPLPPEISPWEATPDNTPPLPEGQVPAWEVKPPPPDPSVPPPPAPREPPDPASYRPPMDNPGGVNGDRPERPVSGLAPGE